LADIVGGEAAEGLAKGESGGHPIIGMNRFKRGFPDAGAFGAAINGRRAVRGSPLRQGGRAAFLLWAFPLGSKIIHALPA